MPPRRRTRAPSLKALNRAELKQLSEFTITIAGSEANIQRIAALLLFADPAAPVEVKPLPPLPWEDPTDPQYQQPPELEIDYNAVRNSIVKQLEPYVKTHGKQQAKVLIQSFGADRLRDVPEQNLVALDTALGMALHLAGHDNAS